MTYVFNFAIVVAYAFSSCSNVMGLNPDPQEFIWPIQWQAIQKIHIVSGNFSGAVQIGKIVYDYKNLMTREDQALVSGPSVKTGFTSNNMTEWFHNTTWYYMDWTTRQCQTTDFGFGQVIFFYCFS